MIFNRFSCARAGAALLVAAAAVCFGPLNAAHADDELPILNLRRATARPPIVRMLQDPASAAAWYPSSPTWFGRGGKTGDQSHTEVLATYDDSALYLAFLNIDRSWQGYPFGSGKAVTDADSNAVWIQTPAGRRFYFIAGLDNRYPPVAKRASGEFPTYAPKSNKLAGWTHTGWHNQHTAQQTIRIPWSTLGGAPTPGSRWRVNFLHYNQTDPNYAVSAVRRQSWAPGESGQSTRWGWLTFDANETAGHPDVSPEATLTLRPASGFGEEVTLRPGNNADQTNGWRDEAITQSNWNDWDPIEFASKEFLQFDLSLIPRNRKIVSATLQNYCRGPYNDPPSDLFLHVVRLAGPYEPGTVTMMTSPLPVENGFRRLVRPDEANTWISFDVTQAVSKAFDSGQPKTTFALSGSSGDIHNGKIWGVSYGRADWYDHERPRLVITFGKPGVGYAAPVSVGSLNYTSVATDSSKNKLTNGSFRFGDVEGHANTTYWKDAGFVPFDGRNVPLMQKAGDVNGATGNPALRFSSLGSWRAVHQVATGLTGGRPYTVSGWFKSSEPGNRASVSVEYLNAGGNVLDSGYTVYNGGGEWERAQWTGNAPEGTVRARVSITNWSDGGWNAHVLLSDFQLEEGASPTPYSETMGVFYPDHPRP